MDTADLITFDEDVTPAPSLAPRYDQGYSSAPFPHFEGSYYDPSQIILEENYATMSAYPAGWQTYKAQRYAEYHSYNSQRERHGAGAYRSSTPDRQRGHGAQRYGNQLQGEATNPREHATWDWTTNKISQDYEEPMKTAQEQAGQARDITQLAKAVEVLAISIAGMQQQQNKHPPELNVVFAGMDGDDPQAFLEEVEEFINQTQTPEVKIPGVLKKVLEGDAAVWFRRTQLAGPFVWRLFRGKFLAKWNNEEQRRQLTNKLHNEEQGLRERVGTFIEEKWWLFNRLAPTTPEGERIYLISQLLRPGLRAHTRGRRFPSLEVFRDTMEEVEKDVDRQQEMMFREMSRPSRNMGTEEHRRANPNQRSINGPPPPQRQEQQQQRARPAIRAAPPTPCRHCGGPHWNNDCPSKPQEPQRQQQGNATRSDAAGRAPAPGQQ